MTVTERHERDRALRRRPVRPRRQPDHVADGRGGHPRPAAAALPRAGARRRTTSTRAATRCTAPGCAAACSAQVGDGPAPQALPHARRQLQPAARRDAHGDPAARAGLQRAAHAPEAMRAHRARARRRRQRPAPRRRRRVRPGARDRRADRARGDRHAGRRPRPGRRPRRAEHRIRTRAPLERAAIRELLQRAFDGTRPD